MSYNHIHWYYCLAFNAVPTADALLGMLSLKVLYELVCKLLVFLLNCHPASPPITHTLTLEAQHL
jgi:hypothetical protein